MSDRIFVSVDLGGTNCRVGAFVIGVDNQLKLNKSVWFDTRKSNSFEELLHNIALVQTSPLVKEATCFILAAPGPVKDGRYCEPPNISWSIDIELARRIFGFHESNCFMINDFVAQACACVSPIAKNAREIVCGERSKDGAIAVIGAGTGLGKAFVVQLPNGGVFAAPTEGGHVSFCAESDSDMDFVRFCKAKLGQKYIVLEQVVSGSGLSLLHEFVTGDVCPPDVVASNLSSESETLKLFASYFGRACRNFALEVLATGGIYVTGGVIAKNPKIIEHPSFKEAFLASQTHANLLAKIPVYLITDEENGLWGAAMYGYASGVTVMP